MFSNKNLNINQNGHLFMGNQDTVELAKEYGMTAKSGRLLKMTDGEDEDSAFEKFVKGGMERR